MGGKGINKHLIVIGIIVILLAVGLSGCEEFEEFQKPDYITITVNCETWVEYKDINGQSWAVEDALVRVEIIKDGGERVTELVSSDAGGQCEIVTGTFNLYKEQPITCIANVVLTSIEEKYPKVIFGSCVETIEWRHVYPSYDFGESCSTVVSLELFGIEQ